MAKNLILNLEDHPIKATIDKALGDEKDSVRLGDDRKEVMAYGQIIQAMNREFEDSHQCWVFKEIKGQRKNPDPNSCREWQIKVQWDYDEESGEPVHITKKDEPLSLAQYAQDNNLTKTN